MAATDDILLRVQSDVAGARRNIEFLRTAFLNAVDLMAAAAAKPDFDPLSDDAKRLQVKVDELGKEFLKAFGEAKKETDTFARALRAAKPDVDLVAQSLAKVGGSNAGKKIAADIQVGRREIVGLRNDFLNASQRLKAAAAQPHFSPLSAEAQALRARVQETEKSFVSAFRTGQTQARAAAEATRLAALSARQLDAELNKVKKTGGGLSSITGILQQIRGGLTSVGASLGVAFGGQQVLGFIKSSALARIELQALRAQLDAAAGSTEAGGRAYEFARDKALELGFSVSEVARSYGLFEAATKQSNLTLQQRREIFESVIEAGRVLQLSQEQIGGALTAVQQIASKGVVSMEELRQQLGERLPGILPILARELGLTIEELNKLVASGKLLADDALPALARGLQKTFGPGLADAIETDAAAIGRLKTAIFEAKAAFAEGFGEETTAAIEGLTEAIRENEGAAENLGSGLGKVSSIAKRLVFEFNVVLRTLNEYNKLVLDPETGTRKLAEALGLLPRSLREVEDAIDSMRPAVELLAAKEKELREEAEVNAAVNAERVRKIYGEMIPALAALAGAETATADAIRKARRGDKEAQAAVEEIIRLARERVPALKAAAAAMDELADREGKSLTVQEQIAEALARSAKEQAEFNQKLFESSGATFKSAEELDKLKVRIINAVDSLVILGATSVEQTDKALDFALKVAAGYRAMGEAVPVELVETIDRLAAASVEGAQRVVKALTEEAEAYAALGEAIPPELLARIKRLTEITEGHTRAVALSVLGMKEFREELFGSGADIETRAAQIVKLVDSLGLLGPATAEQSDIIKEEIQEQLDAFAELGEKPPLDLQRIAERFDVVTSRIEEQRKALKALVADFAGLADKIKSSRADSGLAKDLAEQRAELAKLEGAAGQGPISIDQLNRIDDLKKSISRLEGEVEGLGTNFDTFGDQATASIEDVDAAIRDLIRGNQEALAGLPAATQAAIFNVLGGLQSAAVQGTATQEIIRDAMLKIGDQLQIAGVDTADFAQAMEDASGSGLNLTQELSKLQLGTGEAADAMGDYKKAAEEANKEQEAGAEKAKELGNAMKEAADAVVSEAGRMKPVLLDIDDILGRIVVKCENWKSCLAGAA